MKKITVSGDSWNFLLFKGRIVDARDMADLLRCIDTTTEHEQGRFVHTHDDGAAVRRIAGTLFDNIALQPSAARALLLSKEEVHHAVVSSVGRPGQRMTDSSSHANGTTNSPHHPLITGSKCAFAFACRMQAGHSPLELLILQKHRLQPTSSPSQPRCNDSTECEASWAEKTA